MNQIWVGSDWHLWNTNNNYAHPYRSETDIKQFIDKIDTLPIQKDDLVLFLGDFADILDPDPYKIQWILDKIPGTKIMVYGNHDIEDMSFWLTAGFDGVADMVTIHHMIFTHFPIHVGEEYINFHGHLHTEKFSQLDARWVNVYNPDIPFTRLDDVLEKIQYNNHIATHTDANIFPVEAKGIKDTMDKYTNVLDLSDEFPLVPQDESVIKNQEDIYYNKEKFDSGEINLCFITGHSGSGKLTMGRDMQQRGIEHYELDDLVFIKDHFTLANLKEYGGLIYSFFDGPGKKYYVTKQYLIDNNVPSSDYEDKLFIDFVNYAKQYAKSHPKTKFVLEGVWLFEPGWFKPEEFKDYAFYIKGTSMMISSIRAAKRSAKAGYPAGGAKYQLEVLRQTLAPDALKWYITNEKQIQQYVKYFTRLLGQGNPNEDSTTLNEVLFDDIADTEYWEQDDEYKPGSRKKELMAEDYEEVKIKSTHEPRRKQLKFLKEATEDVVRSLTESYITAPPTDGTADSLVAKPEVRKYRKKLWRRPLYQVSPVDPKVSAGGGSGWYSSIENAIKGRFSRNQIYVGQYYVFTLLPGHYDIRAGEEGPYWYFGGFGDEEPKIETSGIIETYTPQEPYYDWVIKYPKGEHVSSSTSRFSAAESNIRNESADDFDYDSPEVEDDAFGGEEVRFFNQEESYPTSTLDEEQHILTLDDPARFMNEATNTKSSYKKLYPVYINLFSNNTVFGKLIKTVTGSPYTHATIGLDSTMNNMYSFSGIPYNTAPLFLCSGFVRESIWSPAFTRCAFFHTYVTFVDKEGRDKIQKKINNFIKNYDKYDYNTPGLFEYYFGATNTKHHDENKKSMWFCSEFVTACVNASDEVEGFEDIMQSPEDLAHMPNTFDLGEWHVEDFDQKKMDILTKRAEAKFRKNPEMSSSILSEDASGSWIMDESAREKLRVVYKNAQNSGREVYNKMRQHDVHKYVFNLDWKKLHDEFVRLFPKNSPATRFDLIGLILHSYLIPTKQSIENVTENIVNQFKEIKKTVRDGYIKLLDIAKSIIFFWNKKLKDSALKYPSEELITESAGEKYYFNTSSESFRDKKYIKLEYNRYINRKPVKYVDVSMTRDLLDNIIKIIPEELEPAKILAARDAETLTDIIAEQFSKREDVSNRRGGLKTPYYSFGVNAIFRALEAANLNKDDHKHETYINGIRGLVPMDISDAEFTEYLAGMMSQLEEVMKFLTSLILENLTLFGFTLKDQERLLTSTATRADIKKLKREIDRKLLMSSVTDPNNGSVTFDLHYGRLGKVIVSQAIIRSDGKWLTPSRYLIRAREYDYIISAHGHPNNTDRWEIDPITVNGKEYCFVDDLVADINKRDNAKILITCCNPNDYNLAAQFDYLNGVEYANANVVMESTVKGTTKLSKIVSSTISELEALIYSLARWKDGINTLIDEQGIIVTNTPINYIEFTGKIDKFAVSHVHKKVKPENVGETYAKVMGKIIGIYSEIIYTIRETVIIMHQLRTDNLGKYIAKYDSNFSTFTVNRKFNTLQEAVHEMKLMQFINSDIEYSHSGTISIFNENEIVGLPVHLNELDQLTEDVLRLDPPVDYEGLTEAATQKMYPVYVLLSHRSASTLSNVIKALTHSQFSHAALSFDPKLTHMYSFGRNSPNSSKGSFRLESIKKDAYTMGEVPYSLYVVPCTAEQCKLIKKRLKYFAANKSNFTFDMAGLVKNGLGIESEPDDKWFCSRFVADVLNAGAPNGTKYVEHPSLMDPDDFRHTNFAQYVCGGLISDYDYLVAERITKDILHSAADVRSQVGHLKNENTNMIIPSYIKYHNQIWHYKYANDPEDINYPDD